MLEYALLAALLSVGMISAVSSVGVEVADTFEVAGDAMRGDAVLPSDDDDF